MIPLIADHNHELAELCRRHHVKRLEVFGSAAVGDFNPQTSDIDFLVDFGDATPKPWYGNHIDLKEDLRTSSIEKSTSLTTPPSKTHTSENPSTRPGSRLRGVTMKTFVGASTDNLP